MLRQKIIKLAMDERLRMELGENLKCYVENVVCWEVVAVQYNEVYTLAR